MHLARLFQKSTLGRVFVPHLRSWAFCSCTRTGWRGRCPGCLPRWWRSARWPAQWTVQRKRRSVRGRSRSRTSSSTRSHPSPRNPSPLRVQWPWRRYSNVQLRKKKNTDQKIQKDFFSGESWTFWGTRARSSSACGVVEEDANHDMITRAPIGFTRPGSFNKWISEVIKMPESRVSPASSVWSSWVTAALPARCSIPPGGLGQEACERSPVRNGNARMRSSYTRQLRVPCRLLTPLIKTVFVFSPLCGQAHGSVYQKSVN